MMEMNKLMDRDPLDLTEEDRDEILEKLRAERANWKIKEREEKKPRSKKTKAKDEMKEKQIDLFGEEGSK